MRFACAAAGDDVIAGAGVEQSRGKNAVLHVGQLLFVFSCVHSVVADFEAHGLYDFAEGSFDDAVLGSLLFSLISAILIVVISSYFIGFY